MFEISLAIPPKLVLIDSVSDFHMSIPRSFRPDFVLVRQSVRGIGPREDYRNILLGLQFGNVPSINSLTSIYNFAEKPWVVSFLMKNASVVRMFYHSVSGHSCPWSCNPFWQRHGPRIMRIMWDFREFFGVFVNHFCELCFGARFLFWN